LVRRSTCGPSTAARRAVSNRHVPCTSGAVTGNGRARNGRARGGGSPQRRAAPGAQRRCSLHRTAQSARGARGARASERARGRAADAPARAAGVWPGRAKAGSVPRAPRARPRRHQEPPLRCRGGFTTPPHPPPLVLIGHAPSLTPYRTDTPRPSPPTNPTRRVPQNAPEPSRNAMASRAAGPAPRRFSCGTRRARGVQDCGRRALAGAERRCARHAAGVQGAARVE